MHASGTVRLFTARALLIWVTSSSILVCCVPMAQAGAGAVRPRAGSKAHLQSMHAEQMALHKAQLQDMFQVRAYRRPWPMLT